MSISQDLVTLVDSDDNVIGELDKVVAHRHPAQLHRAVSVWLVNAKGEVLFQQRSPKKITGGLLWANTICGNVRPNENYEQCAYRRLREELGIVEATIEPIFTFQYQTYINEEFAESEMDRVFVGRYEEQVLPNPDEAVAYEWFEMMELLREVSRQLDAGKHVSAEKTLGVKTQELKEVTPIVTFHLKRRDFQIAPWTWLMLQDQRIWSALSKL